MVWNIRAISPGSDGVSLRGQCKTGLRGGALRWRRGHRSHEAQQRKTRGYAGKSGQSHLNYGTHDSTAFFVNVNNVGTHFMQEDARADPVGGGYLNRLTREMSISMGRLQSHSTHY